MTIKFECKGSGEIVEVEDVKFFTTDATCLGEYGYDVNYNDGTFNLFPYKSWKLILVKQ